MEHVGKAFTFDYGDFVVAVRYLSDSKLLWEQVKGPTPGLRGEERYGVQMLRPHLYLFWWQEQDKSVVSQVVDFEKLKVYTTWVSPERTVEHFAGTVRQATE